MYLSNGVPVASLSVERTEAIQDRRLGLIQVRQPQTLFFGTCPYAFLDCFFTVIAAPLTAER